MNKKGRIIFRADGDSSIGMGHFIRTLALAEMLKDDYYCVYATCAPSAYQINEIDRVCAERIDLPKDETHFEMFLDQLQGHEIVVLDNYFFDTAYQKAIKSKGCKLVCIDDKHHQAYVCDLIINHTPLVSESDYQALSETKYALGLEYSLLRAPFLDASSSNKSHEGKENSYFVCFGGADYNNLSLQTLKILDELSKLEKVNIVTGAAHKDKDSIEKFCSERESFHHYNSLSAIEMVKVMQECNIAIVPSSSILVEVLSMGLYPITGYFVDNQEDASRAFSLLGLAVCIGDLNIELASKLTKVLQTPISSEISICIEKQRVLFSQVRQMIKLKIEDLL